MECESRGSYAPPLCINYPASEEDVWYVGQGATLSAGVLYNRYLFKLLYIFNDYHVDTATNPKNLSKEVVTTSAGASIGFDF